MINRFRILNGVKYFSLERFQNYLVVIPAKKYFKYFHGTTKSDSSFAPTFVDYHLLPNINFNRHCLINNISVPKKNKSIYFLRTRSTIKNLNTDFTFGNCLFVERTNNPDQDKYKYLYLSTGYGIEFLFTDGSYRKNVFIFGADMSSSVHVDNTGKDVLILGEGPTQGLNDMTKYPINCTKSGKKIFIKSTM